MDELEEINAFHEQLDRLRLVIDSGITEDQIARFQWLEAKHRAYFWRSNKARGPKPSTAETIEYQTTLPIRLRALKAAQQRVFLAEHSDDKESSSNNYFSVFEMAYADIHTYQYAWIGMILSDLQHKTDSLYAIRSMLVYASFLLKKGHARKALCVLRVCERAVGKLLKTMSEETGDERYDLSIQEYKTDFYISMALAELKRTENSIMYFRSAVWEEQLHRMQGRTEYRDRHLQEEEEEEDLMERLGSNVSVLQVISKTLGIPRGHLDESFELENEDDEDAEDFGESVVDKLKDEEIWRCIESLGFGVEISSKLEPMDCCPQCWTKHTGDKKKFCTRCKAVFYCSKECQRNDWKEHKKDCIPAMDQI